MTDIKKTNVVWRLFGDSFSGDFSGVFMLGVVAIIINFTWIALSYFYSCSAHKFCGSFSCRIALILMASRIVIDIDA